MVIVNKEFLHTPSRPVKFEELNWKAIKGALKAMKDLKGIGIAAPQVGRLERWAWIAPPGRRPYLIINPYIIEPDHDKYLWLEPSFYTKNFEGCLSIPGKQYLKERVKKLGVGYINEKQEAVLKTVTGLEAIIIQHELDHLDRRIISDE